MPDVIDTLAGIAPGSPLDAVRAQRPQARLHAQASYDSLFAPLGEADASKPERFAVACFVAGLHGRPEMEAFYGSGLAAAGGSAALQAATTGGLVLLRIEQHAGHGGADLVKAAVESRADEYAFALAETPGSVPSPAPQR